MAPPNENGPPGVRRAADDFGDWNGRSEIEYNAPHPAAQCFPAPPSEEDLIAGGVATIQTFSDGSFQFDPDGPTLAKLLPVEADGGEIIDTVGWEFGSTAPWWLHRRVATHLGDAELRRAAWFGRPVRLVETPAAWLELGGLACCVLDWYADLRAVFRDVPQVVPETPVVEGWLRRALAEQAAPTFDIRCAA